MFERQNGDTGAEGLADLQQDKVCCLRIAMEVVLRRDGGVAAPLCAAHHVQRTNCERDRPVDTRKPGAVDTVQYK